MRKNEIFSLLQEIFYSESVIVQDDNNVILVLSRALNSFSNQKYDAIKVILITLNCVPTKI